ncbi:hypothetical protein ACIRCZ_18690 [Leifsonia sp. NPDC102414]|uniref:hypothetical protein n=1 Tax=Leifsonia sp. NPDC102414 TaxID=3364124 RepID=UPI0037F6CAB8
MNSTDNSTPPAPEPDTYPPIEDDRGLLSVWGRGSRKTIRLSIAGSVAALVVIAGALVVPRLIGVMQHAAADAEYQNARTEAVALYKSDVKAQKDFTVAHTKVTDLHGQVKTIHDQAQAGQYLPPGQLRVLQKQVGVLGMYAGFTAGTTATDPRPAGTSTSTTTDLQAETSRLTAYVNRQTTVTETTTKAARGATGQIPRTNAQLTALITGLKGTATVDATPGLDRHAAGIVTALAKADQPSKDALTASAAAAIKDAGTGTPSTLLLEFLTKAAAVTTAHNAQAAAEQAAAAAAAEQAAADAAARAGATTYADPSTGQTKTTPRTNNGGGNGAGAPVTGGGSTGGGSTGGGAPSAGGGGTPGGGRVIDHTPRVVANGNYQRGCDGGKTYSQSTSSGGTIIINVPYPYTYSTFTTSDGWGLVVYACM